MLELFVVGSETVSYNGSYYITGPNYQYRVALFNDTYRISGTPRYKETIEFLEKHLKIIKEVDYEQRT